jgi:hypothetical protein
MLRVSASCVLRAIAALPLLSPLELTPRLL